MISCQAGKLYRMDAQAKVAAVLQEGIWVVGMILGCPAQIAGVEQGDQLLQIDSMQVDGQSPFQAASAISGSDAEPDAVPEPIVHLQVHGLPDCRVTGLSRT